MKKRLTKKKETATALPELERAMQPATEKRIPRGTNKRLLHAIRIKNISSD
jgi:hypothetical protein